MKSGGGFYEYSILCILPYSGCILDVSPCARRETIGYDQNTKRAVRIQTYSRHGIEIQSTNTIQDKIQRNTTEYRFSTMCEMYPN